MNRPFLIATLIVTLGFCCISSVQAAYDYASAPDPTLTPGSFCARPDSYRFREHVPYCNRDVESSTKDMIIRIYDQRLGTRIAEMPRKEFKIDHLVPLCIGGSNEITNLWPQHQSTFVITDKIEQITCDLMGRDKLKHNEAVEYVRQAKLDPKNAINILRRLGGG